MSPTGAFLAVLAGYTLLSGGALFNAIVQPPSVGSSKDQVTGKVRIEAVLPHDIHTQFIVEGVTAGVMFSVGGCGFIFVMLATGRRGQSPRMTAVYGKLEGLAGLGMTVIALAVCVTFIRIKIPPHMTRW